VHSSVLRYFIILGYSGNKLLTTLFKHCHKLRWLQVALSHEDSVLKIDEELFEKIKSSQLSCLSLECDVVHLPQKSLVNNSMANRTLRFLRVSADRYIDESANYDELLKSFSCLKHLELSGSQVIEF